MEAVRTVRRTLAKEYGLTEKRGVHWVEDKGPAVSVRHSKDKKFFLSDPGVEFRGDKIFAVHKFGVSSLLSPEKFTEELTALLRSKVENVVVVPPKHFWGTENEFTIKHELDPEKNPELKPLLPKLKELAELTEKLRKGSREESLQVKDKQIILHNELFDFVQSKFSKEID